jgi:hypothetical protein
MFEGNDEVEDGGRQKGMEVRNSIVDVEVPSPLPSCKLAEFGKGEE